MPESYGNVVVFEENDGDYKITVNLDVKVRARVVEVIETKISVNPKVAPIDPMPDGFLLILQDYNIGDSVSRSQAEKFWNELAKNKEEGVTKRHIMRATVFSNEFISNTLEILKGLGWIAEKFHKPQTGGRPTMVYHLLDLK